MPLINQLIPARTHEVIRDQIGAIIFDELNNQTTLGQTELPSKIFVERVSAPSPDEMSIVSVSIQKGEYDNHTWIDSDGTVIYYIDVLCNAKDSSSMPGDEAAAKKAHKITGVIHGILMYPEYKQLSFPSSIIANRHVAGFESGQIDRTDSMNTYLVRTLFSVKAKQCELTVDGVPLEISITNVTIAETDEGYIYQYGTE